jgi:hypothetical protein
VSEEQGGGDDTNEAHGIPLALDPDSPCYCIVENRHHQRETRDVKRAVSGSSDEVRLSFTRRQSTGIKAPTAKCHARLASKHVAGRIEAT